MSSLDSLALVVMIAKSWLRNNSLPHGEIPVLIRTIHKALEDTQARAEPVDESPRPAVSIRRSVTPEYIICLEDGEKLRMLKRHLKVKYNMTPDEYRSKWGLPPSYPMTAPGYAKRRSDLAKGMGLGVIHRRNNQRRPGPGSSSGSGR